MRGIILTLFIMFLTVSAVTAQTAASGPLPPASAPVAVRSQADCTGFIAKPAVPQDVYVIGGGDDDFHSVVRQFVQGDSIFISQHKGEEIAVGAEFSVVRPATELFNTRHYARQGLEIDKLGKPYEDVGQVKVTHVTPAGTVAKVTFSCGSIVPGDILVPFQPRVIPEYALTKPLDHFAPLDRDKLHGRITASHNNYGNFGAQTAVYLSLGEKDGVKPGQRFRIYKVVPPLSTGIARGEPTPPETIGEAVILSVQSESCVAMVVASYREIAAGDYVEAE